MAGLNYNRPQLQRADIHRKFDQYESQSQLFGRRREQARGIGSGSLETMLLAYDGGSARLLGYRDKLANGQRLTGRQREWAYDRLKVMSAAK